MHQNMRAALDPQVAELYWTLQMARRLLEMETVDFLEKIDNGEILIVGGGSLEPLRATVKAAQKAAREWRLLVDQITDYNPQHKEHTP